MPRPRGGGFVRPVRGPKRKTLWIQSADQGFVAIAGNTNVIHQSFTSSEPETLVRTRGIASIALAGYSADQEQVGAIGFGVVSEQAAVAGAASIPGPFSDADWPGWFVWFPFSFRFESITQAGVLLASVQIPFDSKAMRKVSANERIMVMVETQLDAARVAITFRMLTKLA